MVQRVINVFAFQIGWFACIYAGALNRDALAALGFALVTGVHFATTKNRRAEAELIAVSGAIGIVFDSVLMNVGLLSFPTGSLIPFLCPFWFIALWLNFATLLNVSLDWLKKWLPLAAVLGAIAGPVTYYAGARIGAVALHPDLWPSLIAIGVEWGIAFPALLKLADLLLARRSMARSIIPEVTA